MNTVIALMLTALGLFTLVFVSFMWGKSKEKVKGAKESTDAANEIMQQVLKNNATPYVDNPASFLRYDEEADISDDDETISRKIK